MAHAGLHKLGEMLHASLRWIILQGSTITFLFYSVIFHLNCSIKKICFIFK